MAAQRLDTAADLLEVAVGTHLSTVQPRAGVLRLVADVHQWQRGARECAAGLRAVAEGFGEQDRRGAQELR